MADRFPPLNALRAFEAAARHLSFKKAAEELFVTPAAVSQQVKSLEEYLGTPLFRRLTRAIELTTPGEVLLPKLREGFDCFVAGLALARRTEERGRINVSAPPNFVARWLLPRLRSFTSSYPQFDLRITGTLKAIDNPDHDQTTDPGRVDAEAQVSVRYGTGDYPGAIVDLLFSPVYVPVCSPKLLGRGPPLRKPSDLKHHMLIHDDSSPGDEERPGWEEWLRFADAKGVDATRGPRFSNASSSEKTSTFANSVGPGASASSTPRGKMSRPKVPRSASSAAAALYFWYSSRRRTSSARGSSSSSCGMPSS